MRRFFIWPLALLLIGCEEAPKTATTNPDVLASGRQLFLANCASCHQADGYGIPNIQPALVDDHVVSGDPQLLIRVVLKGPTSVLPADPDQPQFPVTMPAFKQLSDQDIANLLTYIRHDYGHQASAIEPDQVRTTRAQFGS